MARPFHQSADGWENFTMGKWLGASHRVADSLEHHARGQMGGVISPRDETHSRVKNHLRYMYVSTRVAN